MKTKSEANSFKLYRHRMFFSAKKGLVALITIDVGTPVADSNRHGVKIERGELHFWSIDATGASAPKIHSFVEPSNP